MTEIKDGIRNLKAEISLITNHPRRRQNKKEITTSSTGTTCKPNPNLLHRKTPNIPHLHPVFWLT
jgi:hypothetical protein